MLNKTKTGNNIEEKLRLLEISTRHRQLKDYIKEEKKKEKATTTIYKESKEIENFLNYITENKSADTLYICSIQQEKVKEYITLNTTNPNTQARRLSILRRFYNNLYTTAIKKGIQPERYGNPTTNLKIKTSGANNRTSVLSVVALKEALYYLYQGYGLSKRQTEAYLKNRYRDIAIITLFVNSGLTLSELSALDYEDVEISYDIKQHLKDTEYLLFSKEENFPEKFLLTLLQNPNFYDDDYQITNTLLCPGCLLIWKAGNPRRVYINGITTATLLFYLIFERDLEEKTIPPLFLSLKNRRISDKAIENLISKYFSYYLHTKVTPSMLRDTHAKLFLNQNDDSYDVLAKRMGYKNSSYLKNRFGANNIDYDSDALGISMGIKSFY